MGKTLKVPSFERGIDTAQLYEDGLSERLLGEMDLWKGGRADMATKVNPWGANNYGEKSLRGQVGKLQIIFEAKIIHKINK